MCIACFKAYFSTFILKAHFEAFTESLLFKPQFYQGLFWSFILKVFFVSMIRTRAIWGSLANLGVWASDKYSGVEQLGNQQIR